MCVGVPIIPQPMPYQGAASSQADYMEKVQREATMKRVRYTDGVEWVFKPDTMMWHGDNGQSLTWETLEPMVEAWEAQREEREFRKSIMDALLRQTPEELSHHLRMCQLSLEMAKEMGLT